MKLNLEVIQGLNPGASDRLAPQAAQYIGQLMQLLGIGLISFEIKDKRISPCNVKIEKLSGCPEAVFAAAESVAYDLANIMLEFNLSKLSYEYNNDDIKQISKVWELASEGIRTKKLLTPPDEPPDMERVDIDL